jgi:hypothetical protein
MDSPYKDKIVMFELSAQMFVGPVFYDDRGNEIVCLVMNGVEDVKLVSKLKLIF